VYDCMDHHAGFSNTSQLILENEKDLLKFSHLILASSKNLYDEVSQCNQNTCLVRNAAEYDFFSKQPQVIYKDKNQKKIIGYYGAIAEWFDVDLLEKIANAFPENNILLIGRDTAGIKHKLKSCENVLFIDEVAYAKLPFYLYAFDVCIIPFKITLLTLATNPVKAYEYLSAGKPVVSVDLPELHEFSNLIQLANSEQEFIQQIEIALKENTSEKIAARKKFASEQTWCSRLVEIKKAIDQIKEPLVSIIILTYNNLQLTKACLKSLEQYTDYENIEIIIVDNASSDDTPIYLKQNYENLKNYKVILNNENLGFSAGNNVGLKVATGDYLVLLNNDTLVTTGWMRTMVNHFRYNPKLGLLGPITNNIGNEAKVFTKYKNPNDMFPEVTHIIFKNMGKLLPLKTAAFFCVMMSREVYEKVGLLDESFGLGFFEDDDYCRRVQQQGYDIFCAEDVFIHHHLSASFDKLKSETRQELFEKNKKIYESKWGAWKPHQYR
jgi:GT2 family glycosyltransferase